jgi:hypothetical protein
VHEDKVVLGRDIHDLPPQIRRRLTRIREELFHPFQPGMLRMQGRMIMVVISEVLMHNIEIAPQSFPISALKIPPDKRLVSSTDIGRAPLLGNDGEISGPCQPISTAPGRIREACSDVSRRDSREIEDALAVK